LAHTCQELGVEITPQALDAHFTPRAVVLLAALFQASLSHFRRNRSGGIVGLEPFSAVHILDSTQIALPAHLYDVFMGIKGHATLKVQLSFEYLSGSLAAVEWEQGRSPDQRSRLQVAWASPDSLHLFDLGYFDQQVLAQIAAQRAYFVTRLQAQTALYQVLDQQPVRLDLAARLSQVTDDLVEYECQLGSKARLDVRLIAQRLDATHAQQRRAHALQRAKSEGQQCSAAYLTLLGWDLVVTNVPSAWMSRAAVLACYALRWQIELLFKAWKSQLQLAQVKGWRAERVLCQLYARFIGIVLVQWLAGIAPDSFEAEPSLPKAIQVVQRAVRGLLRCIRAAWRGLTALLAGLEGDLVRFARKDKRLKSPSSRRRLASLKP
jgi:hypothetical protein